MATTNRIETAILRQLLTDEEFTRQTIPYIKAEYFHDRSERLVFEQARDFFENYNALPTIEIQSIELNNIVGLMDGDVMGFNSVVADICAITTNPDEGWILSQTEQFCQDKAVYNAVVESISILDGKTDFTKEAIPGILSDALGVSFDNHVGHDYLEDSEERFAFYHRKDSHLAFDLEYFNKITKGGVVPKTLNVLMAGPGVGKTLCLCHFAAAYLAAGINVLYITLEMAEEIISERVDANLLNVELDDLRNLPKTTYDKKIADLRKKTTGKLIVKEFPTAQAGVGHFRHLMNELRMKKNFLPQVVFVDYINICTSSRIKPGSNYNSYAYIKSIAEELRGFAVEQKFPVWTATQVNREGYTNSDMGMENTAESFGLPATADLFLALITSEELNQLGQIMIKQLKNRYNDVTMDSKFVVGVDRTKMRLFDVEQHAQNDISQEASPFDSTSFGKRDRDFSQLKV